MASSAITKFAHLQIPLEDVVKATNNFHRDNIIGRGGLGHIYKGQLQRSGKLMKISALRLNHKHGERDVQFWTEISALSDLEHTNLVSIIGFCDEKNEKIIITTYAAKGSLKEHLDSSNLTWTQRLKICVGVARAMSYLRYDERRDYGVIHLNINSSTILLDENLEPKLSGFKVSIKQSLHRMDRVFLSDPIGTRGYVDPEIERTKGVTHKSDIYSFGVVLFEILCGRKAFIHDVADRFLAPLAKRHYENQTLQDIILPALLNQMSPQSLRIYSKVAYSCIKEDRAHRPHMLHIVDELEKALEKALKFQSGLENFGNNLDHLKIMLDDIKLATHNFSDTYKTSFNDCYTWYTTELGHFDKENPSIVEGKSNSELLKRHNTVVIKRFLTKYDEQEEELFFTELEVLTNVRHHNIVTLIGFCVEGFEMILVIEKFSNGFLRDYLGNVKNMPTLTWEKRLKICIDVAHALNYLHSEMEDKKMLIHNSISNAKFGLDENWGTKIVDFEWAVFLPPNRKDEGLRKRTYFESKYHVDPEYANTGNPKSESDVYSFGVVMLEILCGKHAHDQMYLKESEKGLVHVARRLFYMGTPDDMIDPALKQETLEKSSIPKTGANKNSLHTFIKVANRCVADTQDQRPTMKIILEELKKALLFQLGKDQVVGELEKAAHEILEKRVERPYMDGFVHKLTKASELQKMHETIGKNMEHLKISLIDIQSATQNFSKAYEIETRDGCTLYRAEIYSSKRHNTVLIKRYPSQHRLFGEQQFLTEINMLSNVKHPNIVTLLGFCVEDSEMILVITDNLSKGFLAPYLINDNNKRMLTWEKRLKICIDVAHALKYIHSEIKDQKVIINRDICSYNIGLDKNWKAVIVDFWWSVFLPPNQEDEALFPNNRIGRPSYRDPQYEKTGKLKRESDVYGFGVLLFEILCGRLAHDQIFLKESNKGLANVARQRLRTGTLEEMIDPIIKEEAGEHNFILNLGPSKDSLRTFVEIAHRCVAETQEERPTMKVVVNELEKALLFQKTNNENPRISLEDLNQATQNFHNDNCIGGGGFGKVYKGNLQDGDGFKTVVAKRLDTRFGQGEQQFLSELQILLEYKHENVIGLLGYCDEKNEKIIVYEYAPKGSLDKYLSDPSLTWVERLNICIDVANALYFFHGGVGKQARVIHRDIKSSNILLNHGWKAKLADFGLSLISPLTHETDYVIDRACGTPGYLDPLYRKSGFLTIESDIYSFGVVLFEMLCGRSTFLIHKHEGRYLPNFIKNKFEEGKHYDVVFEKIREHIEPNSLTTFQKIAYECLHHEREKRPTTKEVLMQLKKALAFQKTMSKLRITLENVVKATNNFHDDNIIRRDGFSIAYKGELFRSGKKIKISARRFDCKHGEGGLQFFKEYSVLSNLKHTNLVSIIGFCDEKDEKIIITTLEANGSLRQFLNNLNLTWIQRLRICVGVARALSYLRYEEGRDSAIIHSNINCDTILLDDNWEAKLSGFEISTIHSVNCKDQVCLCEHAKTMRYMDPSFEKSRGVTHKSDIYSFGVVLFETLCGGKAFIEKENNRSLVSLAKYHYENHALKDIIHPNLWNQMSWRSLKEYTEAAYSCFNEEQTHHPDMLYIVTKLEKALELQLEKALELQLARENMLQEKKLEHLKIPLTDIKLATDDFSKTYEIRSWDGCTFYRAELDYFDEENPSAAEQGKDKEHPKGHNTVVIKRYPSGHDMYGEKEFFTEIEILTSVEHPNIVTLVGFCVEDSEMILVTENVSNGYLGDYLGNVNDKRILTWEKRLKICIDVAHAFKYLHYEMEDQKVIMHRDIWGYTIGLDENWGAKIVNFCSCVFLPPNQEDDALYHTNRIGRPSYKDPQYVKTGKLKRESDVYGFGVVLFEILCGRKAYDPNYKIENDKGLGPVARQSFRTGTLEDMIDPILKEEINGHDFFLKRRPNKYSLNTFMNIAYQCVAETQDQRPTMEVVVMELEKAASFQVQHIEFDQIDFANYVDEEEEVSGGEENYDDLYRETDTSAAQARKGKDIQGIPWKRLNVTKESYRRTRLKQYRNFQNFPSSGDVVNKEYKQMSKGGNYYEFFHNSRAVKPSILHTQLRNLVWATSKHDVYFLSNYSIMHWSSLSQNSTEILNLSGHVAPTEKHVGSLLEGFTKTRICAYTINSDFLVVGGFQGELVCKRLGTDGVSFCTRAANKSYAMTNAIEIYNTLSGGMHFMVSNNDHGVREYDMDGFQLVNHFHFPWAVNHTSLSPDRKLIAVVGDHLDGLLVDSSSGKRVATMEGHRDYSSASAWHPDGRIFATGNQDKTCRVWDLRNLSNPVSVLKGNMGAVRSVRFSSDGQFLVVAEPADFVHVYNTSLNYEERQEIDFFGEIAGVSLSPDDEALYIGVSDETYHSLLQFNK